jgi:putative GTP pyrophosphokinase
VPVDRTALRALARTSDEELAQLEISWDDLDAIHDAHEAERRSLEGTGQDVVFRLQACPAVHSLRARVKDSLHLLEKVIRKRRSDPAREITAANYREQVTDLVGVRALHLFKGQWRPVHEAILSLWDPAEPPVAYIREGDSGELQDEFRAVGLEVRSHPKGYRSIHYLVRQLATKVATTAEIQVRTLFEEGWSEIDHLLRYPSHAHDPLLAGSLALLNSYAGNADDMAMFIRRLRDVLEARDREASQQERRYQSELAELRAEVEQLRLDKREKDVLLRKLRNVDAAAEQRARSSAVGSAGGAPSQSSGRTLGDILGHDFFDRALRLAQDRPLGGLGANLALPGLASVFEEHEDRASRATHHSADAASSSDQSDTRPRRGRRARASADKPAPKLRTGDDAAHRSSQHGGKQSAGGRPAKKTGGR